MKRFILSGTMIFLALLSAEAVTLNVEVPDGTKKCYVCGNFNNWDVSSAPVMNPSGTNLFTLDLPAVDGASIAEGYKYLF